MITLITLGHSFCCAPVFAFNDEVVQKERLKVEKQKDKAYIEDISKIEFYRELELHKQSEELFSSFETSTKNRRTYYGYFPVKIGPGGLAEF